VHRSGLVVTTSHKAHEATIEHGKAYASRHQLTFRDRDALSIAALLVGSTAALVFTNEEVYVATVDGQLRFHLGTAFIRLKALERGELDPMLRAAEFEEGDSVLDTTFGLGRDARVMAKAIGSTGRVVAVESSAALYHLAYCGLDASSDSGSAPIELVHGDGPSYLAESEDNSFDTVLIDPMFNQPLTSDPGFALLRAVADPTPLDRGWVDQARRVASRWVVIKAGQPQSWFDELDVESVASHSAAAWYRTCAW